MNSTSIPARDQLEKLAEALYRFAASLDSAFGMHLKQIAVELAGALEAGDAERVAGTLAHAKGVLGLGVRVGAVTAGDQKVIAAAIERSSNLTLPVPAKTAPVAVDVFAEIAATEAAKEEVQKIEAEVKAEPLVSEVVVEQIVAEPVPAKPISIPVAEVRQTAVPSMTAPTSSAADRQQRIIAEIRQNPTARMRDLLAALPGVSERTIRYDIERLVASGIIEREGIGGPATWYRLRAGVTL